MDSPSSCKLIPDFVKEHNINMEESIKSIDEFQSFNDFFTRKLKPNSRAIQREKGILASPADGKVFVLENINKDTHFFVKGEKFTLEDFFRNKSFAKKYDNGIIRLAPVDYHRFHFPASGLISKSKVIDGAYYSVSTHAIRTNFRIFCENKRSFSTLFTDQFKDICIAEIGATVIDGAYYSVSTHAIRTNFRIFCENKRSFSTLFTDQFKDICIAEIGATMVGGIKQTYIPYTYVEKGDEKGYFFFGGSTVILLLEKQSFKIDKDLL